MMFIEFTEFTSNTPEVLRQVLEFVGAKPMTLRTLPPGMQGERKGRKLHPSCKRKLRHYFGEHNLRLYALLGRDFRWADPESVGHTSASGGSSYMGGSPAASISGSAYMGGSPAASVAGSSVEQEEAKRHTLHIAAAATEPPAVATIV